MTQTTLLCLDTRVALFVNWNVEVDGAEGAPGLSNIIIDPQRGLRHLGHVYQLHVERYKTQDII